MPINAPWPAFNPFLRAETPLLGKIKMLILGPILIPIRFVGMLLTLLLLALWLKLFSAGVDHSVPYTPGRRKLIQMPIKLAARWLLFWSGFLWIQETHDDTDDDADVVPAAVVSNHIGFSEILLITARFGCCFVSKSSNRNLPLIGLIADCMQSIWVDREHSRATGDGSAGSTTDLIVERMNHAGDWPPLGMFPEGTTTNGRVMIHMRTGAFVAGKPVRPIAIKMPFNTVSGYDPSFTCYDIWKHAAGLMAQPFNRMEVTYLPVYVPTAAEKKDPHLFANNVRALIARTLDVPTLELEWMHKLPYELSPKKRAQGLEMLQAANGGKPFTLPTFTEDRNGKPVAATGGGGASSGGGGAAGGGGGGGGKGTGKDKGREAKKDK